MGCSICFKLLFSVLLQITTLCTYVHTTTDLYFTILPLFKDLLEEPLNLVHPCPIKQNIPNTQIIDERLRTMQMGFVDLGVKELLL
ncbi:hypothetical protein ElyMa_003138100 [Elysia marginata]|uniref:Secreted protein n=1 Tax=Elysia marginata TaxID=1093978 RepID=A0AAV4IXI0_9GAST|nr:hypothetical protein ElyMa_003138100 [Elysia marginata]